MPMDWVLEWRGLITNCALRDIRNDRNGRETPGKYSVQIQKVLISNGSSYTFGTDSVGKYFVQNWDIYRLGGGVTTSSRRGRLDYRMVKHTLTVYDVGVVVVVDVMVWVLWYFVSPFGTFPIMSKTPFALETFETRNAQYPKN
jgi:hypothetical protein